ncbi:TIR domain-containing protein [uncultured Aquimarina sp.]|uniref:TIR domain-containing protein n=1 Tax=uncultured Aquimarina sp. TaxID=575652 RepID=UPI00261474B5|nr:TIR domain-containing protein [uncultured Aquimarina sp.]
MMKYKAFISYKHSEISRLRATSLERDLKKYAKPLLKFPIRIFRDESIIKPGSELGSSIIDGLKNSEYLIYLASREAACSEWVQDELGFWCNELKRATKLIIVHLDDEIVFNHNNKKIDWENTNAIPQLLREYISDPLIIDLTWANNKDELHLCNTEYRKIINIISATLDNVSPYQKNDEVVKNTRKNIFLRATFFWILSIAFLAVLAFGFYANKQRKEAIKQSEIAKKEEKEAEEQKNIAKKQKKIANEERDNAINQKRIAEIESEKASKNAKLANEKTKLALANYLTSEARRFISLDNSKSIRILEYVYDMFDGHPPPSTANALLSCFNNSMDNPFLKREVINDENINRVLYSPVNKNILIVSNKIVQLIDLKGEILFKKQHLFWKINDAKFSPDEKKIALISDNELTLLNLKGHIIGGFEKLDGLSNKQISFSPDGLKIITYDGFSKDVQLWSLNGKKLGTFNSVNSQKAFQFSSGSKKILIASNNTGKLIEIESNIISLFLHENYISSMRFSMDNKKILTSSYDNTSKLWDLKGNLLRTYKHPYKVFDAMFLLNDKLIITRCSDNIVRIWSVEGKLLLKLQHDNYVSETVFSLEAEKILTVSKNVVKLWDTKGYCIAELNHTNEVISANFSPNGKKIFSQTYIDKSFYELGNSDQNIIKIWDSKGMLLNKLRHESFVSEAKFLGDSNSILTSSNNLVTIWNIDDYFNNDLRHEYNVKNIKFMKKNKRLFTITEDIVTLWDLRGNKKLELDHNEEIKDALLSSDESKILTFSNIGKTKLWDLNGELLQSFKHYLPNNVDFSPDGKKIIASTKDGKVTVWDLKGNILVSFDVGSNILDVGGSKIFQATFSPDNSKILIYGGLKKDIDIWDFKGRFIRSLNHNKQVFNLRFSKDGLKVITLSYSEKKSRVCAKVWDLEMGIKLIKEDLYNAIFIPENKGLFVISANERGSILNMEGKLIKDLRSLGEIHGARFSSDGKRILINSYKAAPKLVDSKGNILCIPKGVSNTIHTAFSNYGDYFLTIDDKLDIVKLFNFECNEIFTLKHFDDINNAIFSPDGKHLATASVDGTVKLLPMPKTIYNWLKSSDCKIRKLTQEEKVELGIQLMN